MASMAEEPQPIIKQDWYQSDTHVTVTFLGKHSLKKEDCSIKFNLDEVTVQAKLATGQSYTINLKLCKSIVPERSSYKIFPSKLEVLLAKTVAERWAGLERAFVEAPKNTTSQGRDWDRVVNELLPKDDDDNDVNSLFKKIYSDGSDEVRKAMNKSFMESGGTVLSTNWRDVGKDKVEVKPPEGMEWKKWDE